ncbi:Ap-1 complex subunit mu-2 [Plakobranchus ocellatus]|uniref:Ap-1 complex subunit mu-2 n=1 Tax=Plakobranchus ocellatus TaxID=259542 RepID=A0AAV3ZRG2_9GAST|nr:Ap-1 complex subunit mu-2 [Plakobranchus ocellatus]
MQRSGAKKAPLPEEKELPLQPCYSISDISMQQYDQFGKIHTVKIQYVFYRERVGIRPERITPSFVRKPKPNMILDHAPQVSELIKLGSLDLHDVESLVWALEDALMRLPCHRDKTLTYTKDEVQAEVWDEYTATIDKAGSVTSQKARVRIFFLAFLTGMPACELGISDRRRKGKEVVGRHDIIPVRTEDWIRIEEPEFHHVVDMETYERTHNIRFHPLDACQFELVRFRVRPRENRELPLQLRITQMLKGLHFEVRVDLLVTGYHAFSKKCGQFPCEDIEVRIKIPEPWIYYFRYEKRFGYGSLKAVARKPGRIKGLERITMMAQGLLTPALMEASVGSAKYEHLYRSVVWRIPRLPERNHGAYKNHVFVLHLGLGAHDEIPEQLEQTAACSFTMPASTVSKAQVRSISVDAQDPPEKWVRYIARYSYTVEIDNQMEDTESDKEISQ